MHGNAIILASVRDGVSGSACRETKCHISYIIVFYLVTKESNATFMIAQHHVSIA
jgi:hypothetical protein